SKRATTGQAKRFINVSLAGDRSRSGMLIVTHHASLDHRLERLRRFRQALAPRALERDGASGYRLHPALPEMARSSATCAAANTAMVADGHWHRPAALGG